MRKYKIYINETPLILTGMDADHEQDAIRSSMMHGIYRDRPKMFLNYIDMLEKSKERDGVIIQHENPKKAFKDFKSLFTFMKAAGGVVRKDDGKILLIFKRGVWDLPKGKQDPGEKLKATALREVEEEVGLSGLTIKGKVCTTYHTFRLQRGRSLKRTRWYAMDTGPNIELTLQTDEGIKDAMWINPYKMENLNIKLYRSINEVIAAYREKFPEIPV